MGKERAINSSIPSPFTGEGCRGEGDFPLLTKEGLGEVEAIGLAPQAHQPVAEKPGIFFCYRIPHPKGRGY
jgi:hypothetical protein